MYADSCFHPNVRDHSQITFSCMKHVENSDIVQCSKEFQMSSLLTNTYFRLATHALVKYWLVPIYRWVFFFFFFLYYKSFVEFVTDSANNE